MAIPSSSCSVYVTGNLDGTAASSRSNHVLAQYFFACAILCGHCWLLADRSLQDNVAMSKPIRWLKKQPPQPSFRTLLLLDILIHFRWLSDIAFFFFAANTT
eukprot:TRINITY_DN1531_c0_g1_i6.p1 TRINITY_DN1531_c0_g1~~TRINITY_DN1531_c0_g1_i6.p1  ORF type:complete len:102 (+),score=8.93 TRINITY_DN1531_c0_g1_i6:438-743(+)